MTISVNKKANYSSSSCNYDVIKYKILSVTATTFLLFLCENLVVGFRCFTLLSDPFLSYLEFHKPSLKRALGAAAALLA